MISDLHSLFGATVDTDDEYSSLFDLGMTINRDGSISLNENTLDQAIASNPDGVKALFLGQSDADIEGLGDIINNGLTNMVNLTGTVTTQVDAAELKLERLDQDIETATERLNKKYETLTADFARLDSYISRLNNEASLLTSMFESFNNTQQNN